MQKVTNMFTSLLYVKINLELAIKKIFKIWLKTENLFKNFLVLCGHYWHNG